MNHIHHNHAWNIKQWFLSLSITLLIITGCGKNVVSHDNPYNTEEWDTYTDDPQWQQPLVRSSLPALQIGISSPGSRTWGTANMLLSDEMWIMVEGGNPSAEEAQEIANALEVDANGWPIGLPEGLRMQSSPTYYTGSSLNMNDNTVSTYPLYGVFVLTWEGTGDVRFTANIRNGIDYETLYEDSNRIVLKISSPTRSPMVEIVTSDPQDYVRNMKLWAPAYNGAGLNLTSSSNLAPGQIEGNLEPAPGEQEPFWHPMFLAFHAENEAGVLRFMSWMHINGDPIQESTSWEDKPGANYSFHSFSVVDENWVRHPVAQYKQAIGLPYEWMIDLCNELNKDLWIQVPHTATQELVENLATLIAGQANHPGLNANLRVWIEFSNEIWNPVTAYLPQVNMAKAYAAEYFNMDIADITNIGTEHGWASGFLQARFLGAFESKWRELGESDERLINVVSGFVANTSFNEAMLDAATEYHPALPEVLAVTNYFGSGTQQEIYTAYDFGSTPFTWPQSLYETTKKVVLRQLHTTYPSWQANVHLANQYSLPVVAYEGGQHMLALGYGDWDNPQHADFMRFLESFQYSPQMGDIYQEQLALWSVAGCETVSQFVDVSAYSFYGYWGAVEIATASRSDSEKWDAVNHWAEIQQGVRSKQEPLNSQPILQSEPLHGEKSVTMNETLTATGGDGNVTLSILAGEIPPGVSFSSSSSGQAIISGTPTQEGVFQFIVRAQDQDGDVDDKIIKAIIDLEGTTTNAIVTFNGDSIPGTENIDWVTRYDPTRSEVSQGTYNERLILPFNMEQPLFTDEFGNGTQSIADSSQNTMYGGWHNETIAFDTGDMPETINTTSFTGLRDYQFEAWVGDVNGPTQFDALLLWRSDQFFSLSGSGAYQFQDDPTSASLRLNFTSLVSDGENSIRFVIVNHETDQDVFYVSEAAYTEQVVGNGYWDLIDFNNSSEQGKRWAQFTPTEYNVAIPTTELSYNAVNFDDVRAVGIAYHGSRGQWHYLFSFNGFTALGSRLP